MTEEISTPKSRHLVVIGAGGHATSVTETAVSAGYEICAFVDSRSAGQQLLGFPIVGDIAEIEAIDEKLFAVAIGDNAVRERVFDEMSRTVALSQFPTLIHRSAVVSRFSVVANGTVVNMGALIGANVSVGKFCIVHSQCVIGHDSIVGDFASLGAGAILGGSVVVEQRSVIALNASIREKVSVGEDSILGANSYLNGNLAPRCIAFGTPAKVVKTRVKGDEYLR